MELISLDIITELGYNTGMEDKIWSVNEAAKIVGLTPRHVRLLLKRGDIRGKKLNGTWVVLSLDYKRKRKPRGIDK